MFKILTIVTIVVIGLKFCYGVNPKATTIEKGNQLKNEVSCAHCKPTIKTKCNTFYLILSTIDGKITSLDLDRDGKLAWDIQADSQPLYSSSLANMEIIRNGQKLRLIPSLDGALYQFDGERVEAIPMSAESLLSSTYKLSDNSVIVGSKEIRSYGLNLVTGEVVFTCGSDGCNRFDKDAGDDSTDDNSIMIITRTTQVVRSVDIKTGNEKWNFSVGQHQIKIPSVSNDEESVRSEDDQKMPFFTTSNEECPRKGKFPEDLDYENSIRLLVPEGKVVALRKGDAKSVVWEYKFDSPIAKAWVVRHGTVEPMSLFDSRHIPTLSSFTPEDLENESLNDPLLYIGSHNKLLYIQPSPHMEAVLRTFPNSHIGHVFDANVKISWKPYLNTAGFRTPLFSGNRPLVDIDKSKNVDGRDHGLIVWHENYPFDTGYFLYPEFVDKKSHKRRPFYLLEDFSKKDGQRKTYSQAFFENAQFYWKELFGVSIFITIVVHVVLTYFTSFNWHSITKKESRSISSEMNEFVVSNDSEPILEFTDKSSNSLGEYTSRFATDFECVQCLGKGGFGVVFEAINRVDDMHYAVKRTMLPKSEGAKEKVLREVRALAKLEHVGIVRYFNAWVESPPPGWQEERDRDFLASDASIETKFGVTPTPLSQERDNRNTFSKVYNRSLRKEASLNDDSVVFLSDSNMNSRELNPSGSGEFSVHSSQSSDSSSENRVPFCSSSQLNDFSDSLSFNKDIVQSSSSVPFSTYSGSSLEKNRYDEDVSGDSVVFESSKSRVAQTNNLHLKQKSVKRKEFSAIDITLSSQEGDNEENITEASNISLTSAKLFLYIQMQLYRKETLKEWLSLNVDKRNSYTVLDIFDQIVCAVDYVHSCDLMHRDLKPSNIFFSADEVIKVGDFGLVTALTVQQDQEVSLNPSTRHTAEVGTTLYMSPEQILRKPYNLKVDIFSLGLILLELWTPFCTQMERIKTLQKARKLIFPPDIGEQERELLQQMLSEDPDERPTTAEILNHNILKDFAPARVRTRSQRQRLSSSSS